MAYGRFEEAEATLEVEEEVVREIRGRRAMQRLQGQTRMMVNAERSRKAQERCVCVYTLEHVPCLYCSCSAVYLLSLLLLPKFLTLPHTIPSSSLPLCLFLFPPSSSLLPLPLSSLFLSPPSSSLLPLPLSSLFLSPPSSPLLPLPLSSLFLSPHPLLSPSSFLRSSSPPFLSSPLSPSSSLPPPFSPLPPSPLSPSGYTRHL